MMADDDKMIDESDTTVAQFNAMWDRAVPVKTVVRPASRAVTGMAPTKITVKKTWTTEVRVTQHPMPRSETSSAYARANAG